MKTLYIVIIVIALFFVYQIGSSLSYSLEKQDEIATAAAKSVLPT